MSEAAGFLFFFGFFEAELLAAFLAAFAFVGSLRPATRVNADDGAMLCSSPASLSTGFFFRPELRGSPRVDLAFASAEISSKSEKVGFASSNSTKVSVASMVVVAVEAIESFCAVAVDPATLSCCFLDDEQGNTPHVHSFKIQIKNSRRE
jgi:hypothetical protein